MTKQKVIIQTQFWDYTCADGCCYDYGDRLFINGTEIDGVEGDANAQTAVYEALSSLGYDVEVEVMEDDRNDMRPDYD